MIPHGDQAFTDDVCPLDIDLRDSMPIEAQEWLEAIRPHAARDMFQTFPEAHWAHGSAKVINSPRFRVGALLERLNLRGGHGVYYAPSDFAANRRWIVDVIAAKHVWIDFDDAQMPDEFPLQPHGICNTSPGKHQVIWRVAGMPLDRELHNRVTLTLAKLYGGDEGARGINRVLRLPGFMHLKRDPYRVRIVTINDQRGSTWQADDEALLQREFPVPVSVDLKVDRAVLESHSTAVGANLIDEQRPSGAVTHDGEVTATVVSGRESARTEVVDSQHRVASTAIGTRSLRCLGQRDHLDLPCAVRVDGNLHRQFASDADWNDARVTADDVDKQSRSTSCGKRLHGEVARALMRHRCDHRFADCDVKEVVTDAAERLRLSCSRESKSKYSCHQQFDHVSTLAGAVGRVDSMPLGLGCFEGGASER